MGLNVKKACAASRQIAARPRRCRHRPARHVLSSAASWGGASLPAPAYQPVRRSTARRNRAKPITAASLKECRYSSARAERAMRAAGRRECRSARGVRNYGGALPCGAARAARYVRRRCRRHSARRACKQPRLGARVVRRVPATRLCGAACGAAVTCLRRQVFCCTRARRYRAPRVGAGRTAVSAPETGAPYARGRKQPAREAKRSGRATSRVQCFGGGCEDARNGCLNRQVVANRPWRHARQAARRVGWGASVMPTTCAFAWKCQRKRGVARRYREENRRFFRARVLHLCHQRLVPHKRSQPRWCQPPRGR